MIDFGSDGSLGSLLQGSQNIAFGYLGFDPNAVGTYDFTLTVFDRGARSWHRSPCRRSSFRSRALPASLLRVWPCSARDAVADPHNPRMF